MKVKGPRRGVAVAHHAQADPLVQIYPRGGHRS